jgi:hypothetical protein
VLDTCVATLHNMAIAKPESHTFSILRMHTCWQPHEQLEVSALPMHLLSYQHGTA